MHQIRCKAYAKINLTLDVTGKRADGYHDLKTVMHTVSLCDDIHIIKTDKEIRLKTNLGFLPCDRRNIAYRAAEVFLQKTGISCGFNININKRIPVAAGLAGGSADCAAVLRALNAMHGNPLSVYELKELAGNLGSDIPFCIEGGCALAEGRGELLTRLPSLPKTFFVLVKPNIYVPTPWVYKNLHLDKITEHPDTAGCIQALKDGDIRGVAVRMYNVLESVTAEKYAVINKIKTKLINLGALGSIMSGSGSTVFGMFDSEKTAKCACAYFKKFGREVFTVYSNEYPQTV